MVASLQFVHQEPNQKLNSIMNAVEQIEKKFILYQKSSMLKLQKLSDRIWKFQILF